MLKIPFKTMTGEEHIIEVNKSDKIEVFGKKIEEKVGCPSNDWIGLHLMRKNKLPTRMCDRDGFPDISFEEIDGIEDCKVFMLIVMKGSSARMSGLRNIKKKKK